MNKIIVFILCLFFLNGCHSQAKKSIYTEKEWHEDLDYLAKNLFKKHKNAFHYVSRNDFLAAIDSIKKLKSSTKLYERQVALIGLTSLIGDGHTYIPWWEYGFSTYPLHLFMFGEDIRVVGSSDLNLIGLKLKKIDNLPIKTILKKFRNIISSGESEFYIKSRLPWYIPCPELLTTIGVTNSLESAQFVFENDLGEQNTVILNSDLASKINWQYGNLKKPIPPFISRPKNYENSRLWLKNIPDKRTLYLYFGNYPGSKELKEIGKKIRIYMDQNIGNKLIVDLRENFGGDFNQGLDLIKEIKKCKSIGKIYVLIGRETFSAAMSNTAHFKQKLNAVLVGEPTGARPIGYQENGWITLPNSKFKISVATKFYEFTEKDTPGIYPDKWIKPKWKDFKEGIDKSLEWILNQ